MLYGIHIVLYLYRTVLYCTVLYCTVLYCTVLYCTGGNRLFIAHSIRSTLY
jgi:hypothetical protein